MNVNDSRQILHDYLDDVLSNVVQPVNVFTAEAKDTGETRLYFGILKVTLTVCLTERIGMQHDSSIDNPGIRITVKNILYGENTRIITRYFPVTDPNCNKKVLALIKSVETGNVVWDDE